MKILSPKIHGILDFVVVLMFFLVPSLFHFSNMPSNLSYIMGACYLALVLITRYPYGVLKVVPFPIHGGIEFVLSFAFILFPWLLRFNLDFPARNFYVGSGVVLFVVWLITDYKAAETEKNLT